MKTRCVIIDDEPIARSVIKKHLENIPNTNVIAECRNAMEAISVLQNDKVDLMFLDIQMPKLTGLDFLKTLKNPPKVIVVTAYRDFAIEGYELDVIDYLLKPVSFERFLKAMNKYFENNDLKPIILSDAGQILSHDIFIYVKENKKVKKIYLKDILYIESLKEYIRIHTGKNKIVTKVQIGYIEKQLPQQHFLRIHKSYIVGLSYITAFTSHSIEIGESVLPLSRSYKESVLKSLKYHDKTL
ncbi:MAG: response regulator transcription factor [Bacteroidales bacterium]|jgi:DNA-binding LytR/AlgR family response regulator|nr:response regulator transcription factor [Bacteroidales bacterium]